jgi:hypothetical protein
MPFSALIPINYFIYKSCFGLSRVLVCACADKASLMPLNGGLWEPFVAFISQKFKYFASLILENHLEIFAKYSQRLRLLAIGVCETRVSFRELLKPIAK